ncbi:MAG: hypothetical protein SV375_02705, partial [Thermodesulfobacteriota bacterium]|nr:hypothetical protein [Thermodesulfobacteriota bacterium]
LENSAGFPSSFLHEESFAEGAQTLWEEGRGVSILMGRQQDALAYTESILNHIGGILRYGNDSKVHLKLLRADKNASELPAINEDILVDVPAIRRKSWVDTINEVKVKYSKRDFSGDWMMSHRIGFNEFIKKDPDYHITTVDYNQVVFDHLSCSGANEQNDTYLITSVPMELYEDFGFNIDIVVNNITIISGSGNVAVLWGVSTYEGAFRVNFGDAIALIAGETYLYPGTSSWIKLQEVRDGSMPSGGSDTYDTGTDGGSYALYLTILRTYTGGYNGYGYIECEIYTDSARTVKVHTLRVDLHKAVHYTYLWGLSNIYNYGTNRWADGSVLFLKFKTKGGIDYKESNVSIVDNANREIVGKTNSKAIQCALFQNARNAHWAGDRFLKQNSFPMAEISFPANRKVFRYEPGDLFRFTYSPYGITDMVCRVISIKEESVESEVITINAIEDVEYVSQATLDTGSEGKGKKIDYQVVALTYVKIVESPFVVSGDSVSIIPLATREKGIEIGYFTYMSVDGGASYLQVDIVTPFNPYGTLVSEYITDTFQIDDETGFEIDFTNSDVNQIQTTTREQLFTGKNLALLGDEILSFQTIEPVDGFDNRYKLSGIYRGRFDTLRKTHNAGEDFYYIGTTNYKEIKHNELIVGASRKFKLVPYSTGDVGSISEATELSLTVGGRGKKPYMPGNLMANGEAFKPRYSTDITLTWSPRKRSDGAGIGNADTVVDAAPAWEGYFEVEVWVDTVKVRTTSVINDDEWTYTQAMNIADNGSLADLVTFKLFNYIETGGIKYESPHTEITIEKE